MKINSFNFNYQPNFGDALSTKQEQKYLKLMEEIKKAQGHEDGIRVVKIYTPSIPSDRKNDTGIGKPSSSQAHRMYEMARIYGGATAIKFMPMGSLTDKQMYSENKYAGAYQRSALTIGEDIIDISQLATSKYGNILPASEVKKVVSEHYSKRKGENLVDFETTLGWQNQENYPINEVLKIAFDNFKNFNFPNDDLIKLRAEFEAFKTQKEPVDYDDIYTRLALFPFIKDLGTARVDFFIGFDSNPQIRAQKMPQYEAMKEKYKDEIEFFKFKQFLAHKALSEAKNDINSLGMDLFADCPITFSWVEEQMFPDAFLKDEYGRSAQVGWGINAINYPDLIKKENSATHKLFKAKIAHHLQNYDGIRFDVGWAYMNPSFHFGDNHIIHLDAGTAITDFIEQTAREIKGEDYDQRKIMYECDANGADFNLWENKRKLDKVQGLAILTTEEERNDIANIGWGNIDFLRENIGLNDDDFILGTNNHDKEGVLRCAKNPSKSSEHVGALLRVFNLRDQDGVFEGWKLLKDDNNQQEHFKKYIRARFGEIDKAKNSFIMYTDLFGRNEKVDYHTNGTGQNGAIDYKNRLERQFEKNYHRALQDNVGYNGADVKAFTMKFDGLSHKHQELYEKAQKYSAYLKHKGGIYSRTQADASDRADLDIEKMSLQEINSL